MINFGDGKFGTIAKIKRTSTIQVGYRTWRSDKTKLRVIPSLSVNELILKYQFPAYLGIKSFSDTLHEFKDEILIQALSGTQIQIGGVSNVGLGKITGNINNKVIKGRNFSGDFILKRKERIRVNLADDYLFSSCTLDFFIDPIKDEPPSIEFLSPREEFELGESMEVPVILEAEDDYGLSSIILHHGKEKTDLKIGANTRFLEDSITLRIRNLLTGETLKIRGIATDLAGNKTISPPLLIYMPTLEEILGQYNALRDTLENYTSDVEEREKAIADKIENLLYKGDLEGKTKYDIQRTLKEQKDLIESLKKLSELTEKFRTPEISYEIDRIKELIDNPQVEDFLMELNKTMEKTDISFEDLRKLNTNQADLLKSLELFKKSLEYLKKLLELNEFSRRAEEIYRKQKEITSQETNDSRAKLEKALSEELKSLLQDMEKSTEEGMKNIASEFRETKTLEEMVELAQVMKNGETNEKSVKKIEENLRNLALSINKSRENRLGEQITEELKEKAWELGFILRTHNNIIEMKPGLEKGLIEQGLLEALDKVEGELQQLLLKSLSFSPGVFKDIRRAKEKLKTLTLEHTEKNVPRSSMERVNDLLIQAILKLLSEPPPSSQNLASALREIIEQQNSIMQGLGKTIPIPTPGGKGSGSLKELAERQRELANALRKNGKAFGPLSSEMEQMAGDLESGILDKKLMERQRKVLDRLLEAEKSTREGDISRRRHSEPGIFVAPPKVTLPENMGEEKKHLRELLQIRINEPYPEEYKKEVEEYFKKLIE